MKRVLGRFINRVGYKTIGFTLTSYEVILFMSISILNILNPRHYNSYIYTRFITQIYQTSIKTIPHFIIVAAVFGSTLIGLLIVLAANFNLQVQIGALIVTFVINEFASLLTAFFIAYRFSPLIHIQASAFNFENETQELNNLVIPRILSTVISTISLSILFSLIMISGAYLFIFFIIGMDLHTYKSLIFSSLTVHNIFILLSKSTLFGFIVAVLPLYKGLQILKYKHNTSKIFIILFFVELLSLLALKALHAI